MKKILAMLMTALLAVSTLATPVFAEDYWSADQIKAELTLGVEYHNHRDEGYDDSDRFLFVAPQDGEYRFYSTDASEEEGRDADGAVYTENGYDSPAIAEDRDETILGFDMTCTLKEGQRVFFEHAMWGKNESGEWDYGTDGSFIVELVGGDEPGEPSEPVDPPVDPDPEECTHDNAYEVAAIPATCSEEGHIDYVYCPDCDKYFDAEAWLDNPEDPAFVEISPESVITPIDPTYHEWGEWTVTEKPTLTAYGEQTRICRSNSEHKETKQIAKLKDIAKAKVSGVNASYGYTGKAIKPAATVKYGSTKLKSGTDYKVSYSANTKVGTATIKITGLGKYGGTLKKTFKIVTPKSIAKATISGLKSSYVYTGKELTPAVTVKLGSKTLKAGVDYKVTYSKNKNVGTATVKVTGIDNYKSSVSKTFKITKHANTLKVVAKTAELKYSALKSKKQVLEIADVAKITKAKGTVSYEKVSGSSKITVDEKTGAVTVKKGTKKGTYEVKLKVSAKGNSNYKSGSKTVTFKIVVK